MPSSLRIDGWFSRCRDKVQVRARAGREVTSAAPAMLKRDVPESQEPREFRASRHVSERAICNWRVVFQQSNLLLPTGGLSNPMVRMGRSPAHVQACWVDQQFCDVSSLLGRINFMDLYTCIIMQGIKFNGHQHSLSHLSLAFFRDQTPHNNTHITVYTVLKHD